MGMNSVCIVGRMTRDAEVKYTPQGHAVATFGVAVDRFTKDEAGDYQTDFFNVVAWRKSAEFVAQYLAKGRLISVQGRLQQRSWADQTSGEKRTVVEIVAESVQGLDRKQEGSEPKPLPAHTAQVPNIVDGSPSDEPDPFATE